MNRELFRTIISEGWEYISEVELTRRDVDFEQEGNYVIVGARQAGKSYMLFQRIHELMRQGHGMDEIVYINFDDERLIGIEAKDLDLILQAYHSMIGNKPVLFFDEIQNVDGWANFARRLVNQKYRVYISGSNAKMLSRDIETVLGGRYLEMALFPYSFREYLRSMGCELSKNWEYGRSKDKISLLFNDYFHWGGFPEITRYKGKRAWLNSLFSRIFLNDIVVRHRIKNEGALRMIVKRMAESVKQPTSYNRLSNLVKSTGITCSPSSVIDYVRYMTEACIVFSLENYASKFTERETVKKHYFVDNGLLNLFLTDSETFLLENICAIHLYKQYGEDLYYYNKNIEVDFFVPGRNMAVQACYRLADEDTIAREVSALEKLHTLYPLEKAFIVTRDDEATIQKNGLEIAVIPVWKWLLKD